MSTPKQLEKYSKFKSHNIRLAAIYRDLGLQNRSEQVYNCASYIATTPDGEIAKVNLCKDRFCPICMRSKARKTTKLIEDIINNMSSDQKFVMVTLTVPSVKDEELRNTIKYMSKAFNVIHLHWARSGNVYGFIRSFEITYNGRTHEWHPHFHILCAVDNEFYDKACRIENDLSLLRPYMHMARKRKNGNTLSVPLTYYSDDLDEFREEWRKCYYQAAGLEWEEYDQGRAYWQCDIKPVRPDPEKGYHGAAAEVGKYIMKLSDMSYSSENISLLIVALKGIQQYSMSGIFRSLAKKIDDSEENEHFTQSTTEDYIKVPLEVWHWYDGYYPAIVDGKVLRLQGPGYYKVSDISVGFKPCSEALQSRLYRVSYSYYMKEIENESDQSKKNSAV